MKIRSMTAALLLCLPTWAACVEEGSDSDQVEETPVDPDKAQDFAPAVQAPRINAELAPEQDICEILPHEDDPQGPCAYACNEEVLASFVPPNTCMTWLCDTRDGGKVKIGACNN